jgi:hypothetical protein
VSRPAPSVGDLVELPPVRTVVQLGDAADPGLAARLVDDFVLTADCDVALGAVLRSLAGERGEGIFLQGSFGSGKSHLLALLRLLLASEGAWAAVEGGPQAAAYRELRRRLAPGTRPVAVAAVSLVDHSGSVPLEDVCLPALEAALGAGAGFAAAPRAVEEIRAALEARHRDALERYLEERELERERLFDPRRPSPLDELVRRLDLPFRVRRERGAVLEALAPRPGAPRALLIADELSEFLRSKPDARAFNEDVRFLQFLGEASRRAPLWIVASLQEQIEATGEIDQATFNKIKDRYPLRLSLTGRHLRELLSGRLVRPRPGAEPRIAAVCRELREAFPGLSVPERELAALYPVHPATVEMLDDLLPLFSRHRGAVDFLHHQLAGDPARGIPGRLGLPAATLLGPDSILDHFEVRLRETLETAPLLSVALGYFDKELPRLFPEPDDRGLALRLLKVLVLTAVSPIRRKRSVRQLAEMLLEPVTRLDPAANYDHVRDLLDTMMVRGAYLAAERAAHPHDDVYAIDLSADVRLIVERRVDSLLGDPGLTLGRALERLLPGFRSPLLPLASLAAAPRGPRRVQWQQTRREGVLLFCRGAGDPLVSPTALAELEKELAETELDFVVVLLAPGAEPGGAAALLERAGAATDALLVWEPGPLEGDAERLVRRAAARALVREHYAAEASEVGGRVVDALDPLIAEDAERAEALVQRAYREGRFHGGAAEPPLAPAELPSLPFDRLLDRLAQLPLERRFPRHYRIAPAAELPRGELLDQVVRDFLRPGSVELREVAPGLRAALERQLRPLGLARRTSSGFRLQVDPHESELARALLEGVGAARVPLEPLYRALRKGALGVTRPQFELAVLALLFSGQLGGYAARRRVSLEGLDARGFARLDALGPGEMLPEELLRELAALPFVPPRFRQGPFGFAQQGELWQLVLEWREQAERRCRAVAAELERAAGYRAAEPLDLAGLRSRAASVAGLLEEVKVSYAPREGLERLARACREHPGAALAVAELERLAEFFESEWERYLFVRRYLSEPALDLPAGFEPLAERVAHARALAARPEVPLSPDASARLAEAFQELVAEYAAAYEREHRARKSPERVRRLLALRESRAYDLLRRLSGIQAVSVADDRVRVDRALDGAAALTCARFSPELLRARPLCECGFRLGEEPAFPAAAELEASVERGVRQYLAALAEAGPRERIQSALHGLEEVGKGALAARIRRLLGLDPAAPEAPREADRLVDAGLVAALNDALSGTAVLVERRFEALGEALLDRAFPKARLLALVEEWIDAGGRLGPEDYVKVVSGEPGGAVARLRGFVERRYPELLEVWSRHGEEGALARLARAFAGAPADLGSGEAELAAQALEAFAAESPEAASSALERAERALAASERAAHLEASLPEAGSPGDAAALAQRALGERAFGFVAREAAVRALRRLAAETSPAALAAAAAAARGAGGGTADPLRRRTGGGEAAALIAAAAELRLAACAVEAYGEEGPATAAAWEALYREHLALAELRSEELEAGARALGVEERAHLAGILRPAQRALARAAERFEAFYLGSAPGWEAGATGAPLRLRDVFAELVPRQRRRLGAEEVRFVFVDGMRWDVWWWLKTRLVPSLGATWTVAEEPALWSLHPTRTDVQLEAAGLRLPRGGAAGPPPPPGFALLEGPGGERVERLDLVDEKLHESGRPLLELLAEIELHARSRLAPLLEAAPRRCLVALFSDHGFREQGRPARHGPRYAHGGASPQEVLTPVGLLYRA